MYNKLIKAMIHIKVLHCLHKIRQVQITIMYYREFHQVVAAERKLPLILARRHTVTLAKFSL